MTATDTRHSVLLIGKSQRVLDDTVAGLRELGYTVEATNDFGDLSPRFDVTDIDVVVFGGRVPPARRAELQQEIADVNPRAAFVQGLAGIPGLIIHQVQERLLSTRKQDAARAARYCPDDRSLRLNLHEPADVTATVWWQTSFVPPDPESDSLVLVDRRLAAGDHTVLVPDRIPPRAVFVTVRVGAEVSAFAIATEP